MIQRVKNILKCIVIYLHYFRKAFSEIPDYYTSPYPFYILLNKFSLANRKIKTTIFPNRRGRPTTSVETIDLIVKLKTLNPTWGAQRISDELAKVGFKVSKPTVLKYLEIHGLNIPPPNKGLKWAEFIANCSNQRLRPLNMAS